ncbi:MAG: hypothetical protein D6698_04640, partial [Gammaproteobacteria bacterium]
ETTISQSRPDRDAEIRHVPDFSGYKTIKEKKRAFFDFLSPVIKAENDKIIAERKRLISLKEKLYRQITLTRQDSLALEELAVKYRVKMQPDDLKKVVSVLEKRINPVPYRLALAQAANESQWGRSRFSREGNNLFGIWCFEKGCGIVPKNRPQGLTHEVASYETVNASVSAYLRILNRNEKFHKFRQLRFQALSMHVKPKAIDLAEGLESYSERGIEYVDEIKAMIKKNYELMGTSYHKNAIAG